MIELRLRHRAVNVGTISAISANLGTVTAGIIQSADGKYINNLNTGLEVWWAY